MKPTLAAPIIALAVLSTLVAACSSSSGTGSPSATSPGSTSSPVGGTKPAVDLTFTGTLNVTAKGSAGRCDLGRHTDGSIVTFGFNATEADYPGLGTNLNFTEDVGSHVMTVKWAAVQGKYAWFGYMDTGVTISADHRSITLDGDLPKDPAHPERVKGTISCP